MSVSDKLKRTRRHAAHRRKQFFRLEGLVEKFISADGITCFAGFDAAGRSHNQDLRFGKVGFDVLKDPQPNFG